MEDVSVKDHLNKTSFDEGDFKTTLNNFNQFCIAELSTGA